jgi:hypothetical protein
VTVVDQSKSGVVPASGTLAIPLRSDNGRPWILQQVGIDATGVGGGAIGKIKKNGKIITPFVPTGDAPAGEPFIPMSSTETVTVEWTSAIAGAVCNVTFIYDDGVPA